MIIYPSSALYICVNGSFEGTLKGKIMDEVGTLNDAVVRYHDYMTRAAAKASFQIKSMEADDLYQDFFMILHKLHGDPKYIALSATDFTKSFYAAINNFVCNLVTQKRSRNRVKNISIDAETFSQSSGGKKTTLKDTLERSDMNDEDYKNGLIDILSNVSEETGKTVLKALDPDIDSALGHKKAFKEISKFLQD